MQPKFDFGDVVQDMVTSLKGVVMARSEYHTGCTHYGLSPQSCSKDKDGRVGVPDWVWLDETRLKLVKRKWVPLRGYQKTGGSFQNPPTE